MVDVIMRAAEIVDAEGNGPLVVFEDGGAWENHQRFFFAPFIVQRSD